MFGQVRQLSLAAAALAAGAVLGACKDKISLPDDNPGGKGGEAAPAPMPADAIRTTGKHFHVDVAPAAACAPGAPCTVLAELTALDGYKVNDQYPFRFILSPAPGVALEGEPRFRIHHKSSGRLTVQFRRAGPDAGPTRFAGDFKLSVCNPDECLVETAALAVNIP